ncbi:hypothetical protein, partial [Paenibacillus graminis]
MAFPHSNVFPATEFDPKGSKLDLIALCAAVLGSESFPCLYNLVGSALRTQQAREHNAPAPA